MSAINKLLKKKQQQHSGEQRQETTVNPNQHHNPQPPTFSHPQPTNQPTFNAHNVKVYEYDQKLEAEYEKYADYGAANSLSAKFSHGYFPNSATTYSKTKTPLSCWAAPINQDIEGNR